MQALLAAVGAANAEPEEPVVAVLSPGPLPEEILAAESGPEPLVVVAAPSDLVSKNVSAPNRKSSNDSASEDQATAAGGHFGGPEYGHGGHGGGHVGGWGWGGGGGGGGGWGWPKVVNYPPIHAHFKGHDTASHGPKFVKDYHYHKHGVQKHPHYEQVKYLIQLFKFYQSSSSCSPIKNQSINEFDLVLISGSSQSPQTPTSSPSTSRTTTSPPPSPLPSTSSRKPLSHDTPITSKYLKTTYFVKPNLFSSFQHQHHLHREHIHNHNLHKHHVHQTHLHKLHIHQPVYHKNVSCN